MYTVLLKTAPHFGRMASTFWQVVRFVCFLQRYYTGDFVLFLCLLTDSLRVMFRL